MMFADFLSVLQWWSALFILGIIFVPIGNLFFDKLADKGYIFSKVIGIVLLTYISFVLATFKIVPFSTLSLYSILGVFFVIYIFLAIKKKTKLNLKLIIFEELLFLAGILFWSYIRAHEPSIHGLEKYMDGGFVNSILRSEYFPPKDMWFTPLPINYYYFGHIITAVLTKISFLPSFITYNLMLATIFAFAFTESFSIVITLLGINKIKKAAVILGGILAGFLVTLGGNLHILYAFFVPYKVEAPVPIWELAFKFKEFPNAYWYPNATRFIPFTIHEFPIYSFVVSDLHGHVLDIPIVLLMIALSLGLILGGFKKLTLILAALLLAVMYMTNTWDAIIYCIVFSLSLLYISFANRSKKKKLLLKDLISPAVKLFALFATAAVFTIPFSIHFKPFVSGIGILCAPNFLLKLQKLGPFLFEPNHCQKTEWWQFLMLYGFFFFFIIIFVVNLWRKKIEFNAQNAFISILIIVSLFLIIVPEFIYAKDIYPAHYRANTMFKLVYESFIMLSIVSGYVIFQIVLQKKSLTLFLTSVFLVGMVLTYPYFAINSYYGDLKTYKGLNGIQYLTSIHLDDYKAINWINNNIYKQPVILEAQGDSYTDYARISSNTGLPTVLGWTVHEWLWRGSYDIPAPRINEIKDLYESGNMELTKRLISKYNIKYIYVGDLERGKYLLLNEEKIKSISTPIFKSNRTIIYKVN